MASAFRLRSPLLRTLTWATLTGALAAQAPPRFLVSTTSDLAATAELVAISDETLVAVGGGLAPAPQFSPNHWLAQAGFVPGDVDGYARLESFPPGHASSNVFSILTNEGGFEDGDLLTFDEGGGVAVLYSEAAILEALGIPGGNVDVDAFDLDDLGQPLLSFQNDVPGTILGTVQDGDVLILRFDGTVGLLASEAQVQASFSMATGFADAIGDVQGVTLVGSELWVTVLSPSSHDGAVLAVGPGARIVIEEADIGLDGAELDALSVARDGDELACLAVSTESALAGETVHFEFYGPPGEALLVLQAGTAGSFGYPGFDGYGAFYLDPLDPWLTMVITSPTSSIVLLDGAGRYSADYPIPSAPVWGPGLNGLDGWSFQLLSSVGQVSAPLRIERP